MNFKPVVQMWERVNVGRTDSDTTLFSDLMYLGELVSKVAVATMVAAIGDDRDRSKYRQLHALVRADGVGEWASTLDEVLSGAPSQHLLAEVRAEQRELTQKVGGEEWQYKCVTSLHACVKLVDAQCEDLPTKIDGKRWFKLFARLRNKTRGHGAPSSEVLGKLCPLLEESLQIFTDNISLFQREWAYLHRNLSGKYRVVKLSESASSFDPLKTNTSENLPNGVYVFLGRPVKVDLIESTVDTVDFYLANGAFNEKKFELISYFTGNTVWGDALPFLAPIGPLPASETQGIGTLEKQGECFGNLPPLQAGYINRAELEAELLTVLREDRHSVVTLVGRGGIGKTSLALAALHRLAMEGQFDVMLWFSARDLDLLTEGPKSVRPAVLNTKDIADDFVKLVCPGEAKEKAFKPVDYLSRNLTKSDFGKVLFVFDNFETVSNPSEIFRWIDTYIRSPNKVLITTRHREFKGDYPIDVRGMTDVECEQLIDATAVRLNVKHLLTHSYRQDLLRESDGHPYVIKILIGEVAKSRALKAVERIVSDVDGILTALFERTYANLSPGAQRVFLTLCNWRATVPKLALEAVLLRATNEKISVGDAIDELQRSSFVELMESEADQQIFVSTPLVAAVFGKRKLAVSPMKSAIEADTELLHYFGAGQRTDVRHGVTPRVERLIKTLANRLARGSGSLPDYLPMLEFIARNCSPAWLLIADLQEEFGAIEQAKDAIRSFLETSQMMPESLMAWRRLTDLCRRTDDTNGEVHALVEMSEISEVEYFEISSAASQLSYLLYQERDAFDSEGKNVLIRRLARKMEERISEANADDCSRLAWLYVHLKDEARAVKYVQRGLELDSLNEHCLKLAARLKVR